MTGSPVTVYLNESLFEWVTEQSKAKGISKPQVLKECVIQAKRDDPNAFEHIEIEMAFQRLDNNVLPNLWDGNKAAKEFWIRKLKRMKASGNQEQQIRIEDYIHKLQEALNNR